MEQVAIDIKSLEVCIGYEFDQDDCKICNGSLMAPSVNDLNDNKKSNIDLMVTVGKCGHYFHKQCIQNVSQNNYTSCPTCNLVWKKDNDLPCDFTIDE